MKKILYTLFTLFLCTTITSAQTMVNVAPFSFTPADITISVGETVQWDNTSGTHNVNGSLATYPNNPEGFLNGIAAVAPWSFSHTFNTPGSYTYQCDPHVGMGMIGTITVEAPVLTNALLISGVFDAEITDSFGPKGFELFTLEDIPDLSVFGVGAANNGGGTDSIEFTFPSIAVDSGTCIFVADDSTKFANFFGFSADYISDGPTSINGDDAIELFENGEVIDVFGDINVDGSGEPWEYLDGWAYRKNATGPDGSTFVLGNWTFGGVGALLDIPTNAEAPVPYPACTYTLVPPSVLNANDDSAETDINVAINIDVLSNDDLPNGYDTLYINTPPSMGAAVAVNNQTVDYTPNMDECGSDNFTYIVCDNTSCDTAMVSVTITCPPSYPQYSIGVVTTNDANGVSDSIDIACELTGIVYGVNWRAPDGLTYTVIDKNNADDGINLFSFTNDWNVDLTEGDEVVIQGTIDQFRGLTEIVPDTIWSVSSGNSLHDPAIVTSLSEATESKLVKMENMSFVDISQWDTGSEFGFNIDITDGVDTFVMRIDDGVDLNDLPAPTYTNFNVTGIGGQHDFDAPYDDFYQIQPRYMEDLEEVSSVIDPEIGNSVGFFPNPVSNILNIKTEISIDKIQISNALGQKVMDIVKPQNNEELNVSGLSPGIYVITFVTKDRIWSAEFVKQ